LHLQKREDTPLNFEDEPLLNGELDRMNLFPIQHEDVWEMYKQMLSLFWTAEEIHLTDDLNDWEKLDVDEQNYLLHVLAFFAGSDFIVNENLEEEYAEKVKMPELKMFLHFQESMEDVHSTTYALLLQTFVKDTTIRNKLFHAVQEIPTVKAKADWSRKWIKEGSFVERLIAFCCVEGIMFSSSFAAIYWCKKRGLLPGLCQSNELISRDEGLHRDCACLVYRNYIKNKLEEDRLIEIVKEAVELECDFVRESLPYRLSGMNADLMCQYVEYVGDHLLNELIGKRHFEKENPFPWMSLISMEVKSSFFERRVGTYSKQKVMATEEERQIRFDAEF
jgi:ribonucleoside-diphosphate reductase beta chain